MRRGGMLLAAVLLASAGGAGMVSLPLSAAAQDVTAYHRQVYAEVNAGLDRFERREVVVDRDWWPVPVEAIGWFDGEAIRRIAVRHPGDHGDTTQDFYFDDDGLVFVFQVVTTQAVTGAGVSTREERHYFQAGAMVRWLYGDRQAVSPKRKAFSEREAELLSDAATFTAALIGVTADAAPQPVGPVEETTGTFDGFEYGDYVHLLLTVDGETRSFFVLRTDAALERLLDRPEAALGKPLRVIWQTSREHLPEAGGPVEVDIVLTVQQR